MPKKFKGKSTAGAKAKEQKRLSNLEKKRAQDDKKNRELEVQWNVRFRKPRRLVGEIQNI